MDAIGAELLRASSDHGGGRKGIDEKPLLSLSAAFTAATQKPPAHFDDADADRVTEGRRKSNTAGATGALMERERMVFSFFVAHAKEISFPCKRDFLCCACK